ncbi:hypothetical protein [Streptomyces sp. NPDC093707]|uniref:hypothetical protein n=1 Tax=Streptomyces sp. NPDC093707 TaxID=3154984 RepID=UPI003450192F
MFRRRRGRGDTPAQEGFLCCPGNTGVIEWMPHHQPGNSVTTKTVAYTPSSIACRPSSARYDVIGSLLAVSDSVLPTAIRPSAASTVAGSLLARPDSKVLGVVGSRRSGRKTGTPLRRAFLLEQILVYDVEPTRAASYVDRVKCLGFDVRTVGLAELEKDAGMAWTVTSVGAGNGPVLLGEHLQPHAQINAIGADLIGKFEGRRPCSSPGSSPPTASPRRCVRGNPSSFRRATWGRT